MQCPSCGAEFTEILARHEYLIEYNDELKRWVKSVGYVFYGCGNCTEELDFHDIEDALKQADEL